MVFRSARQRRFVMMKLRKGESIPALTGTLGQAQPIETAQRFRVWVADKLGGDDSFFEFRNIKNAQKARIDLMKSRQYTKVDAIIGASKGRVAKFPTQKYWEFALKRKK